MKKIGQKEIELFTFGYKINAEHHYEKDELCAPIVEQILQKYADGYKIKESRS